MLGDDDSRVGRPARQQSLQLPPQPRTAAPANAARPAIILARDADTAAAARAARALPVQVSTRDGRVKVIGAKGMERSLRSAYAVDQRTRQLAFLHNRGVLYRVTEVGGLRSWAAAQARGRRSPAPARGGGREGGGAAHRAGAPACRRPGQPDRRRARTAA